MLASTVSSKILRAIALKEGFHFEVTPFDPNHEEHLVPIVGNVWIQYGLLWSLFFLGLIIRVARRGIESFCLCNWYLENVRSNVTQLLCF